MITTRQKLSSSLLQRPWFGAAVYLVFGILWISSSDRLLALMISDTATLTRYQSYKGYFYVSLTAALAWFLLSQKQHYANSLRVSERALRDTFDYAATGIAHVSLQGKLLQVNRAFCQMLGFSYTELTQLTFQQLTHPLDLDKDLQALQPLIDGKADEYTLEKRYLRKDGTTLWARLSVAIVRCADSAYFISVIHDISQQRAIRQQLAEDELRFRTLLDNAPQIAIQGYNADGTTLYWNKASEVVYGYSKEEAIGRNLLDLIIPPSMHKAVGTAMAQMASSGVAVPPEELLLQRKDGSMVAVLSGHVVIKLSDGEPQIYCIDVALTGRQQHVS
ncbi:PAS domain S-box protein [Rheinheimera sp. NSM]|uniref:PAS domain S-box protein n=1 Tax=Rheinheimera sp. NSM TaxID=3457884 RepID=UPI004035ED91